MISCATLDFETLATTPDARILSVGLCLFDLEEVLSISDLYAESHHIVISGQAQENRKTCEKTIGWWNDVSRENREAYDAARQIEDQRHIIYALWKIHDICEDWGTEYLISNGIGFDAVILKNACEMYNVPYPVDYWEDIDLRTMKLMSKANKPAWPKELTKHHARHDAIYEAHCAQVYYNDSR